MPEKFRLGIRMEVPDTIECQGCGREIRTESLKLFSRFWCLACHRMMFLGRGAIRFHFLPRHRRLAAAATWFGVLSVAVFPVLAVVQIAWLARNSLVCCVDGIHGAAVPLDTLAYGPLAWTAIIAAGALLSVLPGWGLWMIRRTNRDRQLVGGLLAVLMGVQRLGLIEVARTFAFPNRLSFSWPFVLCLVNGVVAVAFVPVVRRIWPGV